MAITPKLDSVKTNMRENLISVDEDGLLAAKQVIVEEFRFGVTVVAETHQMFL